MDLTQEQQSPIRHNGHPADSPFLRDVLRGLAQRRKAIPAKYFYDEHGSALFDRICELEEYYPTRSELAILRRYGGEITEALGPCCALVELGSGSSLKTRTLLSRLDRPAAYIPIDISSEHLHMAAASLAEAFPEIEVLPLTADFTQPCRLPEPTRPWRRRVVYFPGSTIGNFEAGERSALLARIAELAGPGGGALIGIDLKKSIHVLEAAYNDREGVTAAFNLNVLRRANQELKADFDLDAFDHRAFYNGTEGRVEMHLVSRVPQAVRIAGHRFEFEAGENIHTECSYKFMPDRFKQAARAAGLIPRRLWSDDEGLFGVLYFEADEVPIHPTDRRDSYASHPHRPGVRSGTS